MNKNYSYQGVILLYVLSLYLDPYPNLRMGPHLVLHNKVLQNHSLGILFII